MACSPGEIFQVYYPKRENKNAFTRRPALFLSDNKDGTYRMCQITGTNRFGKIKGVWIDEKSDEYINMGLTKPSFINMENILSVPKAMVLWGPIGKYKDIDQLIKTHHL